jgi:hypothetical protein
MRKIMTAALDAAFDSLSSFMRILLDYSAASGQNGTAMMLQRCGVVNRFLASRRGSRGDGAARDAAPDSRRRDAAATRQSSYFF